jgi:hypothetical protein
MSGCHIRGPLGDVGVEPTLGFEPRTCCLRNSCSTAELCRPQQRVYQQPTKSSLTQKDSQP